MKFPKYCCEPNDKFPKQPKVPSVLEGSDLYEAYNNLNSCVKGMSEAFNENLSQCAEAYKNLQMCGMENGSFYSEKTLGIEQGNNKVADTNYWLVHKNVVDRCNDPVRVKMVLAMNNTTNSGITEDMYDMSERVYSSMFIPATSPINDVWYGNVIYNGNIISTSEQPDLYTIGFTRGGFLKVYANTIDISQLLKDGIENSIGCNNILIQNGKATEEVYTQNITNRGVQTSRLCIGQNENTGELIVLGVGDIGENENGLTVSQATDILLNAGCTIAVEIADGENANMIFKGQMPYMTSETVDADNLITVPKIVAGFAITRACKFKTDFDKELNKVTQEVGKTFFQISSVKTGLAAETAERKEADIEITNNLNAAIANLTQLIKNEETARKNADIQLQKNIDSEESARESADTTLQNHIDTETEAIYAVIESINSDIAQYKEKIANSVETKNLILTQSESDLQTGIYLNSTGQYVFNNGLNMKQHAISGLINPPTSNPDLTSVGNIGYNDDRYLKLDGSNSPTNNISFSEYSLENLNGISFSENSNPNEQDIYMDTSGAINIKSTNLGTYITIKNGSIVGLSSPTQSNGVANKQYVDNKTKWVDETDRWTASTNYTIGYVPGIAQKTILGNQNEIIFNACITKNGGIGENFNLEYDHIGYNLLQISTVHFYNPANNGNCYLDIANLNNNIVTINVPQIFQSLNGIYIEFRGFIM